MGRVRVLMDSNILMLSSQLRLDPFTEVEGLLARRVDFGVVPSVIKELERISLRPTKEGRIARFALALARRCQIWNADDLKGAVDDALLRAAKRLGTIVCTADSALRTRLREQGVSVITLRGHRRFFLDGVASG